MTALGARGTGSRLRLTALARWRPYVSTVPGTVVAAVVGAVVSLPVLLHAVRGGLVLGNNDVVYHVELVDGPGFVPSVPHWGFHVLVSALVAVLRADGASGPAIAILTAARAATAVAVYLAIRGRLDRWGPSAGRGAALVAAATVLLFESPRVLVRGSAMQFGDAYAPLQVLFNPTSTLLVPLAVLAVPAVTNFTAAAMTGPVRARQSLGTAGVLLGAALVKPSLATVLLPVLPLWAASWARRRGRAILPCVGRVVSVLCVPVAAVIAAQVWYMTSGAPLADRGSIVWDPGFTARTWGIVSPLELSSVAVAFTGLVYAGAKWVRNPRVVLVLGATVVATAQFALLAESGPRAVNGNLGHGLQLCLFLLVVESLRSIASEPRPGGAPLLRGVVVAGVMGASLLAGFLSLDDAWARAVAAAVVLVAAGVMCVHVGARRAVHLRKAATTRLGAEG